MPATTAARSAAHCGGRRTAGARFGILGSKAGVSSKNFRPARCPAILWRLIIFECVAGLQVAAEGSVAIVPGRISHVAQLSTAFGPSGKTTSVPSTSAWMLGPWAVAGSVKLRPRPRMIGCEFSVMSVSCDRKTSDSRTNVAVSDQFRTVATIRCPPLENASSIDAREGAGPGNAGEARVAKLVVGAGVHRYGRDRRLPFAVWRAGAFMVAGHVAGVDDLKLPGTAANTGRPLAWRSNSARRDSLSTTAGPLACGSSTCGRVDDMRAR